MDTDFSGGPKQKKSIQPLNDLTIPKLPNFSSFDDTSEPATQQLHSSSQPPTSLDIPGNEPDLAGEAVDPASPTASVVTDATSSREKASFFSAKWTISRRVTFVAAAVIIVLIGGGVSAALLAQPPATENITIRSKPTPPKPTTVASNLTGLQVDASINARPVTGVMIENSQDARPQSGLDQAGVVFEAIAEGGITRFLALYQDGAPDYIGPVRSARPYYVQWCMSFDCALAHAGGSPEALGNIKSWGTKDLDQFANSAAFWRIDSRYAPHNLYTSTAKLNELEAAKSYGSASFTPLTRKKDAANPTPNAASIDLNISSSLFNSHYDYDAATNSYRRSQGGATHTVINAAGAEVQLQPKAIVALITSYGIASDGHSQYGVIGTGEAYVFQDGMITKAAWHKADTKTGLSLTDETGKPLGLNAGQAWFTALSGADKISYK